MKVCRFIVTLVSCLGIGGAVLADSFPSRPITIIDAYPPGGSSDVMSRIIGEQISKQTGQAVIVAARPGAAGTIGASYVARAKPDGYTLLIGNPGPNAIAASTFNSLPYDVETAFQPVTLVAVVPMLFCVKAESPIRTPQDIVSTGKAQDQGYFGATSIGSMSHIIGEMLNHAVGTKFTHVPYKGASPLIIALIGGEVDFAILTSADAHPHVESGKVRCVAHAGTGRSSLFPDVPTLAEAGISGVEAELWFGYLAPAGTPASVVQELHKQFDLALSEPGVRQKLSDMGLTVRVEGAEELAARIRSDVTRYRDIIRAIGLPAN